MKKLLLIALSLVGLHYTETTKATFIEQCNNFKNGFLLKEFQKAEPNQTTFAGNIARAVTNGLFIFPVLKHTKESIDAYPRSFHIAECIGISWVPLSTTYAICTRETYHNWGSGLAVGLLLSFMAYCKIPAIEQK